MEHLPARVWYFLRSMEVDLKHRYAVFGLTLASELELPELPPGDGPPDVTVRRGEVPEELAEVKKRGVLYQAGPGRLLLKVRDVARFLVSDGRQIVVATEPEAEEGSVRIFLYGSALGALLQQRGVLPLHASAIEADGRAIVLAGNSGEGKSTLAAAFHRAGYRVLADDVVAVHPGDDGNGGAPRAYPAYPILKLWPDALARLEIDPGELARERPEIEKTILPTGERFTGEPLPISHVYLLHSSNKDELELHPITGMGKLAALWRFTYRRQFLDGLEDKQQHFRMCTALAKSASLAGVVRPSADFKIDELRQLLEEDFSRPEPSG